MPVYNALVSRVDAQGLIPEAVAREIVQTIEQRSISASLMRTYPMSTATERIPVIDTLPTAYWVNGDTGLKQTTKVSWTDKTLVAEEMATIVPIPEAVLADSDYDLWAQIRPLLADACMKLLDDAVVFGVNRPASFAQAIVPAATAAGQVANGDPPESIDDALSLLEAKDVDVSAIAAKASVRGAIRKALAALGGAVSFGQAPNDLFGYPLVYPVPSATWTPPTLDAIVGDWSAAIIGVRQDITYKLLTEGVISDDAGKVILNLPQQDSVALRVVARFAFQTADMLTIGADGQPSPVYPFALAQRAA